MPKDSPNLDLLRAIAVGLVVLAHMLARPITGVADLTAGYGIRVMGHLGVAMFFVHTTLVLMGSLERHGESAAPFFLRRFFRIYPLSISVVLLVAGLQWAAGNTFDVPRVVSNLLLVQNITGHLSSIDPLWSLPYEVQMYLALPAIYALVNTRGGVARAALLWGAGLVIAIGTGAALLRFLPCFLPGVLAFALSKRLPRRWGPMVLVATLAAGIGVVPVVAHTTGSPEWPLMWVFCLLLGIVLPCCRDLTCRPVSAASKTVATYSYGIYLTHIFALAPVHGLMQGPAWARWAATMVLLPGLAYIAYHGIEKHGIKMGARMALLLPRPAQTRVLLR